MHARRSMLAALGVVTLVAGLVGAPVAVLAAGSSVSLGDVAVAETATRTGTVGVEVPVVLTPAPTTAVSLGWRTVAGTAGTADFVAASGTLNVAAGTNAASITVQVRADKLTEPDESFSVELTAATGAAIADASGTVTIRPPAAGVSVGDVTLLEPDAGAPTVAVPVTLGAPANKSVTVGWQLRAGSGSIPGDAPAASGSVTIAKGALGALVRVAVTGDTAVEPDETLDVVVTSVANASLADGTGTITLRNGDVPPPNPFGWNPPSDVLAGDTTILYVESGAGDYVGQGRTYRYTQATSQLTVSASANRLNVSIRGDEWWTLLVNEPSTATQITTGMWSTTTLNGTPGASFFGEGRSCDMTGRFIVDGALYVAGSLRQITLRWEQRCGTTGALLRGYFRWSSSDPTVPPPPADPSGFAWTPAAGVVPDTGDFLYLESPTGDYIGGGQTLLYQEPAATFTVHTGSPYVELAVDDLSTLGSDWTIDLAGRYNQSQLQAGLYDAVHRYPFHNPAAGGLSVFGQGRGCNELDGSFVVDQIAWDASGLVSISARFEQSCEGTMPPLHGALRWTRG